MKKQRGVSSALAGFLCLLIVLSFFHESRGDVVPLKDLIKPQDVEYDVRVEFTGKLTEKEVRREITKLEEKYKLKVVRRANGKAVEFRLKEKGDAGKVAANIKKENKSVAKADVNPLFKEFAWQKIEKNKLKVTYKKHVKEHQKKYLEEFYNLKAVEKPKTLPDKSVEQSYEVAKVPLLKAYNGLRKVGAIKTVGFVYGIAEIPQNKNMGEDKGLNLRDPEIRKKVIELAGKKLNHQKLTEEEEQFYKKVNITYKITDEIKKKYSDIAQYWQEDEYFPHVIYVSFKKNLTDEELRIFGEKYDLVADDTSVYKESHNKSVTFVILSPDKTAIDLFYILKNNPGIQEVSLLRPTRDLRVPQQYSFTNQDTLYPSQWHLFQDKNADSSNFDINAPEAWKITKGSSQVVIAVIEQYPFGDVDHDDLKNKMFKDSSGEIIGFNFMDNKNNFSNNVLNYKAHGTAVMGIAAAQTDNGTGVAGVVPNPVIMPVTYDGTRPRQLADAIKFAVDKGARVINMSFWEINLDVIRTAIQNASSAGVILVAAVGNSNERIVPLYPVYPASYPEVIGVGGTQKDGKRWCCVTLDGVTYGSNYGSDVDLSAPATGIVSTTWDPSQPTRHDLYSEDSPLSAGTSFSAPMISGVAALVISKYGTMDIQKMRRILYGAVNNLGDAGKDDTVNDEGLGYGRVDAFKAVAPPRVQKVTMQQSGVTKFSDGDLDGDNLLNFTDEDIDGDEYLNGADQNDDGNGALDGAPVDTDFNGSADAADDDGDNIADGTNKASDIESSTYKIPAAGDLKLFIQLNETMFWNNLDGLGFAGGVDPTVKLVKTDGGELTVTGTGDNTDWSTKEIEENLWNGKVTLTEADLDNLVGDVRVKISGSQDMAGEALTKIIGDGYEYTLTVPAFRPSPEYPGSSVKRSTQVGEGTVAMVGGVIDIFGRNFNTDALTMKMEIYKDGAMVGQAVTMNKTTAFEFKGTWDTGTLKADGTREYPNGKYKVTLKAYDSTSTTTPVMTFSREVRVENDFAIKNVSAANKSTYSFSLTSADPNLEIKYSLTRQAKIDMEVYGSNSDKSFTTEQVTDLVTGTNGGDCAEKPQGENQTQDWNNAFLTSSIPAAFRKSDLWVEVRDCDTGQKIASNKFRVGDTGIDNFAVFPLSIQPTVLGSNKANIQFTLSHSAKVSIKVYKESLVKSGNASPIKVILQATDTLPAGQNAAYFWDGTADAGYTCNGSSYVCDASNDYYIVVEETGAETSSAKKAYVNVSGISGTPPPAPSCNSFTLSNVNVYPYILQPQVAGYSDPEGYKDTVTISYDLQGGSNSCIHQVKMYVWQSHGLLWEWKADFNHLIGGDEATYEYGGPGDEINDNKVIWDGQICYVGEEFEYLPWPHPVQKWKCDKQIPSSQYYFQLAAYDSNGYRVAVSDVKTIRVITPAVNVKLRTLTPSAIEKAILASNGSVPERIDIYENIVHEATLLREFYNPKEMQYIWDGRDNKAQNYVINPGNTYVPILYVPYPSKAQIPVPYMYCEGTQCPVPALSDVGFTQSTSGGYTIQYRAAGRAIPTVEILDAAKQNVLKRFTTPDQPFTSGEKTIAWDGKDDKGVLLSKVEGLVLRINLDNLYGYARVEKVIPSDIIPPVITHTPTQAAQEGTDITFTATVTDNVSVQKASLWYGYAGGTSPSQTQAG